jgi:hypothetical protein
MITPHDPIIFLTGMLQWRFTRTSVFHSDRSRFKVVVPQTMRDDP